MHDFDGVVTFLEFDLSLLAVFNSRKSSMLSAHVSTTTTPRHCTDAFVSLT